MRNLWPVHTVVFDVDDTLYLERDYVLSGFGAVDQWLQANLGLAGFHCEAELLFNAGNRGRIFDEVLTALGHAPSAELIQLLITVYRSHRPRLALLPDASDTLDWARQKFNLGLITDGYREAQENKIEALGLRKIISCCIVTDALGRQYWKPSQEPYRRVMTYFGGAGRGYVYVGDNPAKDFIGAKALGWRTVRIRRENGEHAAKESAFHNAAEMEITNLSQLRTILARD